MDKVDPCLVERPTKATSSIKGLVENRSVLPPTPVFGLERLRSKLKRDARCSKEVLGRMSFEQIWEIRKPQMLLVQQFLVQT